MQSKETKTKIENHNENILLYFNNIVMENDKLKQQRKEATIRYNQKQKQIRQRNKLEKQRIEMENISHMENMSFNNPQLKFFNDITNTLSKLQNDMNSLHSKLNGVLEEMDLEEVTDTESEN